MLSEWKNIGANQVTACGTEGINIKVLSVSYSLGAPKYEKNPKRERR
jgi:hypothetical protein